MFLGTSSLSYGVLNEEMKMGDPYHRFVHPCLGSDKTRRPFSGPPGFGHQQFLNPGGSFLPIFEPGISFFQQSSILFCRSGYVRRTRFDRR